MAATTGGTTMAATTGGTTMAAPTGGTTAVATTGGTTGAATTGGTTGAATTGGTTGAATTGGTTGAATTGGTTGAATTGGTTAAASTNGTTAISTVPAISESISRGDCGSTKLCAEEPSECDPTTGDCFFLSAKQNGQKYDFELSGQTDGYIAAGLSETASQNSRHTAYICARDNNAVRFFTGFIEDSSLNVTNSLDSSNVQGTVSQGKVQCIFTADLSNPRTRASSASFSLSVTTGPYDASTGVLGSPVFKILTPRVNLSDPSANITNQLSNDTTSSSAYPVTATQSFLPALLVTVCMIAFTAM
ncbi:putative ferric-chelate reductase 1 [Cyprinodon tularosa]|uniref:putative ferric-chelate reductase 1 n=1 Tax=Cyprinodon tularosa TaxID=77115 RepID=UPI0018E23D22|nr:putative ferric-chelate reductase 1 [Cyprinodon tularosa]